MPKPILDLKQYLSERKYSTQEEGRDFTLTTYQERVVKSVVALLVKSGIDVFAMDLDCTLTAFHTFLENLNPGQIDEKTLGEIFSNLEMTKALLLELKDHEIDTALITFQKHDKVEKVLRKGGLLNGYFDHVYAEMPRVKDADKKIREAKLEECLLAELYRGDEKRKRKEYPAKPAEAEKDFDKKEEALEQIAREKGVDIRRVAIVSDRDPELLSAVERARGVTFGIDQVRYDAIAGFAKKAKEYGFNFKETFQDLDGYKNFLERWAEISDKSMTQDKALELGFEDYKEWDDHGERKVVTAQTHLSRFRDFCREKLGKLDQSGGYFLRHGITMTSSLRAVNLPLVPIEAPSKANSQFKAEYSYAQGWEVVDKGLTESNVARMAQDLVNVAVFDETVTQEERIMFLWFLNIDNRNTREYKSVFIPSEKGVYDNPKDSGASDGRHVLAGGGDLYATPAKKRDSRVLGAAAGPSGAPPQPRRAAPPPPVVDVVSPAGGASASKPTGTLPYGQPPASSPNVTAPSSQSSNPTQAKVDAPKIIAAPEEGIFKVPKALVGAVLPSSEAGRKSGGRSGWKLPPPPPPPPSAKDKGVEGAGSGDNEFRSGDPIFGTRENPGGNGSVQSQRAVFGEDSSRSTTVVLSETGGLIPAPPPPNQYRDPSRTHFLVTKTGDGFFKVLEGEGGGGSSDANGEEQIFADSKELGLSRVHSGVPGNIKKVRFADEVNDGEGRVAVVGSADGGGFEVVEKEVNDIIARGEKDKILRLLQEGRGSIGSFMGMTGELRDGRAVFSSDNEFSFSRDRLEVDTSNLRKSMPVLFRRPFLSRIFVKKELDLSKCVVSKLSFGESEITVETTKPLKKQFSLSYDDVFSSAVPEGKDVEAKKQLILAVIAQLNTLAETSLDSLALSGLPDKGSDDDSLDGVGESPLFSFGEASALEIAVTNFRSCMNQIRESSSSSSYQMRGFVITPPTELCDNYVVECNTLGTIDGEGERYEITSVWGRFDVKSRQMDKEEIVKKLNKITSIFSGYVFEQQAIAAKGIVADIALDDSRPRSGNLSLGNVTRFSSPDRGHGRGDSSSRNLVVEDDTYL